MALSKIERATAEAFSDVLSLLKHNWIQIEVLEETFREILPRYAIKSLEGDSHEFERKFLALKRMWVTELELSPKQSRNGTR